MGGEAIVRLSATLRFGGRVLRPRRRDVKRVPDPEMPWHLLSADSYSCQRNGSVKRRLQRAIQLEAAFEVATSINLASQ